jgi:phage shock protein A
VPNLEERVALLEGRVQEQAAHMTDLRGTGAELRQEIRDLHQELRQVASDLREEMRQLRDEMNRRFERMDQRFDAMDRRFTWLVGMMVTGFLAVIGTVAGAFWGLLQTVQ